MHNREAVEQLAQQESNGKVSFVKEVQYGNSSMIFLRSSVVLPAIKIVIFEYEDGRLLIPNRDFNDFELMLKEIRPSLSDADTFLQIFAASSPSRRKVCFSKDQVLAKYQNIWKQVSVDVEKISFYCEDLLQGNFEKITVTRDYAILVEVVGPSRKYTLR